MKTQDLINQLATLTKEQLIELESTAYSICKMCENTLINNLHGKEMYPNEPIVEDLPTWALELLSLMIESVAKS